MLLFPFVQHKIHHDTIIVVFLNYTFTIWMTSIFIFQMEITLLEMSPVQSQGVTIRNRPCNSCYAQISCRNREVNVKVY